MSEENMYVGKVLNGKEVVDTSADSNFMYFYFQDGSYDVAPIIDGIVSVTFDENIEMIEGFEDKGGDIQKADAASNEPVSGMTKELGGQDNIQEEETELGFYKTLQPIPYTDEDGNEIGVTEVGSIQEVPVTLGDFWVAEGLAEKVDAPKEESLLSKIGNAILGEK